MGLPLMLEQNKNIARGLRPLPPPPAARGFAPSQTPTARPDCEQHADRGRAAPTGGASVDVHFASDSDKTLCAGANDAWATPATRYEEFSRDARFLEVPL